MKYKTFLDPRELANQTVDLPMRFWRWAEAKILNNNENKGISEGYTLPHTPIAHLPKN